MEDHFGFGDEVPPTSFCVWFSYDFAKKKYADPLYQPSGLRRLFDKVGNLLLKTSSEKGCRCFLMGHRKKPTKTLNLP